MFKSDEMSLWGRINNRYRLFSDMKAFFCLLAVAGAFLAPQDRAEAISGGLQPDVPVTSCILKETGSPNYLFAKDIDKPLSPASLTKIMTCFMAFESGRMDEDVVITKEATMVEPTKAGFKPGEKIKLRDLVKAAMVNSSNDAAFAIAIHLGGNVDSFVSAMNMRARAIGMTHTRFTNPAGFDTGVNAGNSTTARDLMILTEHAIRIPEFNEIARLNNAVFTEQTTHKSYCLKTHNKLLDIYPYTVGIKTGFTNHAGRCLIARAVKDHKDLLMVMLNARANRWNIASNMFDSGFESGDGAPIRMASEPLHQDPVLAKHSTGDQVLANRQRALAAIRQKLEVQSDSGSSSTAGVKPYVRSRTVSSVKREKSGRHMASTAQRLKKEGRGSSKVALSSKSSKKGHVVAKTALKSKKQTRLVTREVRKTKKRTRTT